MRSGGILEPGEKHGTGEGPCHVAEVTGEDTEVTRQFPAWALLLVMPFRRFSCMAKWACMAS